MSKLFSLYVVLFTLATTTHAQTKIGGTGAADASAILELNSANRGLLLSRVSLTSTTTWGLNGATPVAGMQVYNTNTGISAGSSAYPIISGGIGVYYWDGSGWVATKNIPASPSIGADNGLTLGYNSAGNIGIGGTLAKNTDVALNGNDLNFTGTGNVGIGNNAPGNRLEITGSIPNASGLRFTNVNNGTTPIDDAAPLGVNTNGDVVVIGTTTYGFAMGSSTTQTLNEAGFNQVPFSPQIITFAAADLIYDMGGAVAFDDAGDSFTILKSGIYAIEGYIGISGSSDGITAIAPSTATHIGINLVIRKNGGNLSGSRAVFLSPMLSNTANGMYTKTVAPLSAGDVIQFAVYRGVFGFLNGPFIASGSGLGQCKRFTINKL